MAAHRAEVSGEHHFEAHGLHVHNISYQTLRAAKRTLAWAATNPYVISTERLSFATQDDGPLEHVHQLSYIARPRMSQKVFYRVRRKLLTCAGSS